MTATMDRLTRARASLITAQPFFASLALRLTVEETAAIETADTNGKRMRFNPAFVETLTQPELAGVVAHEVMHCALDHITRLNGRDLKRWNRAIDEAANPYVLAAGLTLPSSAWLSPEFAGLSADEIYAKLPAEDAGDDGKGKPGAGQGSGQQNAPGGPENAPGVDSGACGGIEPTGAGTSPAEETALREEWKVYTMQAAMAAKAAGKLSGELAQLVEEMRKPVVDWREVLRRFIATAVPNDYGWLPPNRRYIGAGLYLPGLVADRLARIGLFVDTSRSTWDFLPAFAAEFNAILQDCRPDSVALIYCDTRVNSWEEIGSDAYPVKLEAKGGGGTDFRPPFDHIEAEGLGLDCAIYLTDLECNKFPLAPPYPVLWASAKAGKVPFGEIVRLTP